MGDEERTLIQKIKFYTTTFFVLTAIGDFSAFVFIIPFIVDPAYKTISAKFTAEPVTCMIENRIDRIGVMNCTWSSCAEGCTRDLIECWQILVKYSSQLTAETAKQNADNEELWDKHGAQLFVNVKGCGYPPTVNCSVFAEGFTDVGYVFPCYYSREQPNLVVEDYDIEEAHSHVVLFTVIPILTFLVSIFALCIMYCPFIRKRIDPYIDPILEKYFVEHPGYSPAQQDGEEDIIEEDGIEMQRINIPMEKDKKALARLTAILRESDPDPDPYQ